MKIKIHVHGLPHEADTIYLKLVQTSDDNVAVAAVDSNGDIILDDDRWALGSQLLTFTDRGTISLSPMVFPEFGFEQDHDLRIKLDAHAERQTALRAPKPVLVKG